MDFDEVRRREAAHFLPVVSRIPVALVEGRGSRVWDVEGREYVDLTAGWGVTSIGHSHPAFVEALSRQAGRLVQTTNFLYTLPQLELAERLVALTPAEITRAFFVSAGTEAIDGALKLAHRATGRSKYVSTRSSFHGRSLGALSVIGQARYRDPYLPLLRENVVVPYDALEAATRAIDQETAAVIVEPVQGEGGVNVPSPGYLAGLRKRCDETGALLVLDEIQTGVGRTGRMFALEHDGVVPDVLVLGKGLGGGMPLAAFLCTEGVADTVVKGDHGGTYAGNVLACEAANTVLRVIADEGLVARAARIGDALLARLREFSAKHPERAVEARGRGLLLGRALASPELASAVQHEGLGRGVIVNVAAGKVLRLFPALNIPEDELWPAIDLLLDLAAEIPTPTGAD